ncbi:MAG: hypothetical protein P8Y48_10275 [Novosphingobium sp.]
MCTEYAEFAIAASFQDEAHVMARAHSDLEAGRTAGSPVLFA